MKIRIRHVLGWILQLFLIAFYIKAFTYESEAVEKNILEAVAIVVMVPNAMRILYLTIEEWPQTFSGVSKSISNFLNREVL